MVDNNVTTSVTRDESCPRRSVNRWTRHGLVVDRFRAVWSWIDRHEKFCLVVLTVLALLFGWRILPTLLF